MFLPAGGISSLGYTPSYLRKNGISKTQTVQASAIYAFVGILTVFIIALPVLVISTFQQERIETVLKELPALIIFIAVMIWLVLSLQKKAWVYRQIHKNFPKIISSIDEFFSVKISSRPAMLTVTYSL